MRHMTQVSAALVLLVFASPAAAQAPIEHGPAPAAAIAGAALAWPAEKAYRSRQKIETSRDSIGHETTISMVVEKGAYLLWIQRPRVTVASVRYDSLPAGEWPASVLIEFRTQSPQYTATNLLTLTGDDATTFEAPATASRLRQRTMVTDHTLTFVLPLEEFLSWVHADRGTLSVGGVTVKLRPEQLESLRAFAMRVKAGGA